MSVSDAQYQDWADDLADLDQQIEDLQKAKKDFYATVRDEHGKKTADALKSAIKIARMDSEKRSAAEEVEAEAFRILQIIQAPRAPRATRARENIEEFPSQPSPKVGQAREDAASSCGDAGDQLVHSSVENEGAEISTPLIPVQDAKAMTVDTTTVVTPEPAQEVQILRPGQDAGSSNGRTTAFDAENAGSTPAPATTVISRAEGIKKLRPLCMSPERCRSSGGKAHCNTCLKAAGQSLVSA